MELVDGGNLSTYVSAHSKLLEEEKVQKLFYQLCEAVQVTPFDYVSCIFITKC